MKKKKILSLLLTASMLISIFPQLTYANADDIPTSWGERDVYLHAFNETPKVTETKTNNTIYMGEDANVFLSVNKPNMGDLELSDPTVAAAAEAARVQAENDAQSMDFETEEKKQAYIDEEVKKATTLAIHKYPQYCMQGYSFKIYFDTKYLQAKSTDAKKVVDVTIPNSDDSDVGISGGNDVIGSSVVKPGYLMIEDEVHSPSPSVDRVGWVTATVMLMKEAAFFPNKNEDYWYNLCKVALTPVQTGTTRVWLDYNTNDTNSLELFAKNVHDEKMNFKKDVVGQGEFYLTIEDKNKPSAPRPDVDNRVLSETTNIKLVHENAEACEIYYSRDGITDPTQITNEKVFLFEDGDEITLTENTVIKTALKRVSDGVWSDVKTYTFNFKPKSPVLFNSEEKSISTVYDEEWSADGYSLTAYDNDLYSKGMSPGSTIYYTFKSDLSTSLIESNPLGGDNANEEWVKTTTGTIGDKIKKSCVMRLVTVNKWGMSSESVYYLGLKPGRVSATPSSGLDREMPIELFVSSPQNAEIYYTLNGGDPRNGGEKYTESITLYDDTVIKAAAYYDGKWGDVTSFWYLFTSRSGVKAFHPSGTYTGGVDVRLYPEVPGKQIEISYNGGISFEPYDGSVLHFDSYTEFRAKTTDESGIGDKFVYVVKPYAPVFSPEASQFSAPDTVNVSSPAENGDDCELWITTDGSEPTENDKVDGLSKNIKIEKDTTIKAVIVKNGEFKSEVVTNLYSIVYNKPPMPLTTLLPGFYTRKIGSGEFTTKFKKLGSGISVFYSTGVVTESENNNPLYENKYTDNEIEVIDHMLIDAVSKKTVGGEELTSDAASFKYLITPEAPIAAPSANVENLPVIPVDVLSVKGRGRCIIKYSIGETDGEMFEGSFDNGFVDGEEANDYTRVYIDTKTGNAYRNARLSGEPICSLNKNFSNTAVVVLSCVLDGVESGTNAYMYSVDGENMPLIPPYADKQSGNYLESKTDFEVKLSSVYSEDDNVKIEWKFGDADEWIDYDVQAPKFETKDKLLYIRCVSRDNPEKTSQAIGYVYYFYPPAPTISQESGVYKKADNTPISITQSDDRMNNTSYKLYYYQSTDNEWGSGVIDSFNYYKINASKTVKAYAENVTTGRKSETVSAFYVVEDENALGAAVTIKAPFNKKRISDHLLGKGEYANGILFSPEENVAYNYKIDYTAESGLGSYTSDTINFNPKNAFVPTEKMDKISLNAWIYDDRADTEISHTIEILHLGVPTFSVSSSPDSNGYYSNGTEYFVENKYASDKTISVFYTLNGDDPQLTAQPKIFSLADKSSEKLTSNTTVKARYFSACGDEVNCEYCKAGNYSQCENGVFGDVAEITLPVTKVIYSGGGGGGGGSYIVDKTKKNTKDIFGNEHPTHISYINGYPDGTVAPEGEITREEITAILYRITNHEYEKPFVASGEMFPDVAAARWSAHDIEYMADKGVVKGYPEGTFLPENNLTRGEFAALIARFAKLKEAKEYSEFDDFDEEHWAYEDVMKLVDSGLMQGYEDGTYRAESFITRAEVMSVINKILGRNPSDSYVKSLELNPYSDLSKNKWYYTAVLEATVTHDYVLDKSGVETMWENMK